jgi:hypothetical protein
MSYNWTSAATPQGRERLKDLVENDKQIVIREKGVISVASIAEDGCLIFGRFEYDNWEDAEINETFDDLEFLDPEPTAPVVDEFIKGLDYCECNGCGWVGQVGETIEIDDFDSCPKCKEQSMYFLEDDQAEDHWNEYRALKPMTGRGIGG